MTTISHSISGSLALFAQCGELAVAIEASTIYQIRRAAEVPARRERELLIVDLDGERVPGFDLGELLGLGVSSAAWVVAELRDCAAPRVAFRVGRCITVRPLPPCTPVPPAVWPSRPGAIIAAFVAGTIPELDGFASGVVLELGRVLGPAEHELMRNLLGKGAGLAAPSQA